QVAVNDPLPVEVADDLDQAESLADGVGLADELGREAAVRDVLHGQVRDAVPPAGALDGDEVRVSERGPKLGSTPEPGVPFFPRGGPRREDLQGYRLLERAVQGAVGGAPGAAADLVDDLVAVPCGQAGQPLARADGHGGHALAFEEPAEVVGQLAGS